MTSYALALRERLHSSNDSTAHRADSKGHRLNGLTSQLPRGARH